MDNSVEPRRRAPATSALSGIVANFELLGDWEQRYQYLIELGERLPPFPDALRIEDNRVKPCMSSVYVSACPDADNPACIRYRGDCDTAIIKGVLALLVDLCNGRELADIEALDMDEVFSSLQLDEHLSPNRHVGVYAIVDLMKAQARQLHCQQVN
jgi:cysteine desulfuration protein SufE